MKHVYDPSASARALALCVLMLATPLAGAQSPQAGADPLSVPYSSRLEAAAVAERLRAQGTAVRIEEVRKRNPDPVYSVELHGFGRWTDAQRTANALREHGVDINVFATPDNRGYAVGAGTFRSAERADAMVAKMLQAGYKEIYVFRVIEDDVFYRLIEERAPRTGPSVLVFDSAARGPAGAATETVATVFGAAETPRFSVGVDDVRVEAGLLTASSQEADSSNYLHGSVYGRWQSGGAWEARATARLFAWQQSGDPDFSRAELDYGETWLRYRDERFRVTAGAQTVLWGRVDELPPTDRLSVHDVTRFALDDLSDRRRAVPALRVERFMGNFKADLFWVPRFRAAELPHRDSIWYPVNRQRGALLGIEPNPVLAALVAGGSIHDRESGEGGVGLRLSHAGQGVDYAFTLQQARHSLPYFELNPAVRAALLADPTDPAAAIAAGAGAATFTGRHPRTTVVGGDIGLVSGAVTWRLEAAWLSDVPVTTRDLRMETVAAVDWAAGVEFYPGDADTRANLQLTARHLLDAPAVLDRTDIYALGGELETVFASYRWRGRLRFSLGLDERDVYVNPELAYIAREPHEFYFAGHFLGGAANTAGGFYRDNDLLTVGWRARY